MNTANGVEGFRVHLEGNCSMIVYSVMWGRSCGLIGYSFIVGRNYSVIS